MPKQDLYQIVGPFGVDRRDSAIVKHSPGILWELKNFLIHNGNAEVREGMTNALSTLNGVDITSLEPDYRILSLHRYYGLDALEAPIKEFYAAVNGASNATLRKWDGSQWNTLPLPPNITLTKDVQGNFEQLKDRTYYTNQKEPVLMIKKEDSQVYEAGIPDADPQVMIADCETKTEELHADMITTPDRWAFYTDGEENMVRHFLDGGFERHTEGDFGLTLEQADFTNIADLGRTLKGVYHLPEELNLEWFYRVDAGGGTVTTGTTDSVTLNDSAATFTSAHIGLQIENVTDGSTAIILQVNSPTQVVTSELAGGSDNEWQDVVPDVYTLGSRSTLNDYIAIDIFRFTKIDIDEVTFQLSSTRPDSDGDFSRGFHVTIYTDSDMDHFSLRQRTMLANWAMNPYSNKLFLGRFRKTWFINIQSTATTGSNGTTLVDTKAVFTPSDIGRTIRNIRTGDEGTVTNIISGTTVTTSFGGWGNNHEYEIEDDWSAINYIKIHLMSNAQTSGTNPARITIDNIRLLKTPPLPSELSLQVATCDANESWHILATSIPIESDFIYATEGVSCKKIPMGLPVRCNWTGTKDLSKYGEGTAVDGSDIFVFDVCGDLHALGTLATDIKLYDKWGSVAIGIFSVIGDIKNVQQRHIHIQEFTVNLAGGRTSFDWEYVDYMLVINYGFTWLYMDHVRIEPAAASKMLNNFMPLDLIIFDIFERGIDHFFGENPIVDTITDFLFKAYANFTRHAVGQGTMVFPEYTHGRYKIGDYSLASMQLQVDAGGAMTVTFIQDDDLTEYEEFNFNLDGFLFPKKNDTGNPLGTDWVEISGTPTDEFSIWISTPDIMDIAKITFRFYANANADFMAGTGTHVGANNSGILVKAGGAAFDAGLVGKRIRNESWESGHAGSRWGIVGWVLGDWLGAWGMVWETDDEYTIDTYGDGGFNLGALGLGGKPEPDADNYYEYVLDTATMFGSLGGVVKGYNKALEYHAENEETLIAARELAKEYGVQRVYKEEEGEGWWQGLLTWKRKDLIPHLQPGSPWSSLQCIAAHEIIVQASSKKNAIINFQDYKLTKKGAVKGEGIIYKIKLEDEMGYLGPASDPSSKITVSGNDVNLTDIVIPYDTRIVRKRIYRTDSLGKFRYLDTIDRIETSYLDQIPEEFLGLPIEPDVFKPPKARHMRKIDNRIAYIDCIDRRGTRRSSRFHLSLPFIPHQCLDKDAFDLNPDDGQQSVWCEWYYGYLLAWKERSFYTIDLNTFEKSPRDLSIGCIAPLSVAPIPAIGFGWLSHEGVIFGDHTNLDKETGEQIWDDMKDYSPEELSHAVGWYDDRYYYIFFGYDDGVYNTKGFACCLPTKTWTELIDWNVQCISKWTGGTDHSEIYAGSDFGYINKLFDGETDLADNAANTVSQISSRIRAIDYDFGKPQVDKYMSWIIFHAKNLSSDPTRKALLTITPYYDQIPVSPMDDEEIKLATYKKYDLCHDPGDGGTLIGFSIDGKKRYAIKEITLDINDLGFRPDQH